MAEVTLADPGDEPEIDSRSFYTVFAGSSQEEVANAKVFWSSVTLQPPLESRLVSSDIKQRLKVAPSAGIKSCKERCCHCQPSQANIKYKQLLIEAHMQLKADEKERYLKKAKKRMEILELIKKQREERIQKEQLALPYKPKKIMQALPSMESPVSPQLRVSSAVQHSNTEESLRMV
ncbi:cilia- and flagella-associated protein HOATZ isoform X1 [Hypanus sabinus]|uniref:cilia- and flagella-associated protein HOATZ isoform X1 n=1 Tax=Hypanus sabinus TaxID=79690 RepID=UPI0028C48A91|nr:cilia- and flagella-associated protein HOATZ isoform X1 [Hypanus sabinus]